MQITLIRSLFLLFLIFLLDNIYHVFCETFKYYFILERVMRQLKKLFFLFFIVLTTQMIKPTQKTIYLHFFGHNDSVIFNMNGPWARDGAVKPFFELRKALAQNGYKLTTFKNIGDVKDNPEYIVFFNLACSKKFIIDLAKKYGTKKMIAFLWEPPVKPNYLNYDFSMHQYFSKIFTWDKDLIDQRGYFQFYYPQPTLRMLDGVLPFEQKKLSVMVARNQTLTHPKQLCTERLSVIKFFENKPTDFDLYGRRWPRFRNYKGAIKSKLDALKRYKFCFAYENTKDIRGYVTEKIFDCFVTGCVPVYYGASDICDYVPKNCFVDRRDFKDNQELYQYLNAMDKKTYREYVKNINDYLKSSQSDPFSISNFIKTFQNGLGI